MKNWVKIALYFLFVITVVILLIFAKKQIDNQVVKEPLVHVNVEGENAFLTKPEVITRLRNRNFIFADQRVKQVNFEGMETYLLGMEEVDAARVYANIDGTLKVDITLREPIARIFNKYGESFYLDAKGYTLSSGSHHTARILVVTGDIPDRLGVYNVNDIINNDSLKTIQKLDDVYRISKYVCNDPFMQTLIGQIHRESNGDFILLPIIGGQKIVFGAANTDKEVKEKFKKLQIFYKEAMPFEGWGKYSEINLKFDKQIVCKLKAI